MQNLLRAAAAAALMCALATSALADPFRVSGLQVDSRASTNIPGGQLGLWNNSAAGLTLVGSLSCPHRQATSTPVTVSATTDCIVGVNVASASTVNLPAASNGLVVWVKDESGAANTNNITVQVTGGANIDAAATKVINTAYGGWIFYADSSKWWTVASNAAGGGSSTLATVYNAGAVAADQTALIQAGKGGPIVVKANGAATGDLFIVEDSSATKLVEVSDNSSINMKSGQANVAGASSYVFNQQDLVAGASNFHVRFQNNGNNWFSPSGATGQSYISFGDPATGTTLGQNIWNSTSPFGQIVSFGADGASTHVQVGANASIANTSAKLFQIAHNIGTSPTEVWSWQLAQMNMPANVAIKNSAQGATNTTGISLTANEVDGASTINLVLDGTTTIPSGKLISIRDAGAEQLSIIKGGTIQGSTGTAQLTLNDAATVAAIRSRAANVIGLDRITANRIDFTANSVHVLDIDGTAIFPFTQYVASAGKSGLEFQEGRFRHLFGGSSAAPTAGTLGTNVTSITCTGSDVWGTCSIVTGGATTANASLGTITLQNADGTPVMVDVSPANQAAATTGNAQWYLGTIGAGTFQIKNVASLGAGTYVVNYQVGG